MDNQPARKFTRLSIAILVAAVLVSTVLIAGDGIQKTETISADGTTASTETVTDITTVTHTATETATLPGNSTVTGFPNSSVVYSPVANDLQLAAVIQPIVSPYGQNITITATILDVGSTTFEMNATGLVNPVYGPCAQYFATGVYVYSGYYSQANVSRASQVQLYNPNAVYTCPTESFLHYTFQPLRGLTEVSVLTGYWTGSSFQAFPQGEYTATVFDAWGQVALGHFQVVSGQSVSTSSSCSGYPPGGDCLALYSYNFTISVGYGGPWTVSYQGYNFGGVGGSPTVNGSYSGSGPSSRSVVLTGYDNQGLTLCATAQKLDGSSATLTLGVTGSRNTSAPYGSVTYCGTVVP